MKHPERQSRTEFPKLSFFRYYEGSYNSQEALNTQNVGPKIWREGRRRHIDMAAYRVFPLPEVPVRGVSQSGPSFR